MTHLRHASRHVHQTVADHLRDGLGSLNWFGPSVPFGEEPIRLETTKAFRGDQLREEIAAGSVYVTLGSEPHPLMQEMGGPLAAQEYPFFVDVFMDAEAVTRALSCDIRDLLLGRFAGFGRGVKVVDQGTGTPVEGMTLSFDDIERVEPEHTLPLHWQAVHATAVVHFNEVVW